MPKVIIFTILEVVTYVQEINNGGAHIFIFYEFINDKAL